MKKREYRIVKRSEGYYPMIKKKFLFFSWWMRIGEHEHGYGLYSYFDHPHSTEQLCSIIIHDYDKWVKGNEKGPKVIREFSLT